MEASQASQVPQPEGSQAEQTPASKHLTLLDGLREVGALLPPGYRAAAGDVIDIVNGLLLHVSHGGLDAARQFVDELVHPPGDAPAGASAPAAAGAPVDETPEQRVARLTQELQSAQAAAAAEHPPTAEPPPPAA